MRDIVYVAVPYGKKFSIRDHLNYWKPIAEIINFVGFFLFRSINKGPRTTKKNNDFIISVVSFVHWPNDFHFSCLVPITTIKKKSVLVTFIYRKSVLVNIFFGSPPVNWFKTINEQTHTQKKSKNRSVLVVYCLTILLI